MDTASTAARLRALLAERGLTQAQAARATGITKPRMNRIVHGKCRATATEIGMLVDWLEIELGVLLHVEPDTSELDALQRAMTRLTTERDELARELDQAIAACEQSACERATLQRERAELREQVSTLHAQLRESKRLLAELREKERKPAIESYASWPMSAEMQRFEREQAEAQMIGTIVGKSVEFIALLWKSSNRARES